MTVLRGNHASPGGCRSTRVARLTASGGGLGIVGITGVAAAGLVSKRFRSFRMVPPDEPVGTVSAGLWDHATVGASEVVLSGWEPVVLVRTGADCWEIHAHGGVAVLDSIVGGLCSGAGVVECSGEDWPQHDGDQADRLLWQRLATAGGWRAAKILSRQLAGQFAEEMKTVARQLIEVPDNKAAAGLIAAKVLTHLEKAARVGLRLPIPWRVALRGDVNVGKSSLVNALAGYARSLVSPLAGTTRDLLETRLVLDGWEIELIDTAGLHAAESEVKTPIERAGIDRGEAAATAADLVLELVPARAIIDGTVPATGGSSRRLIVATKADLLPAGESVPPGGAGNVILTSARTGAGLDDLVASIIDRLVPEAAGGGLDHAVPVTSEQLQQVLQLQRRLAGTPITPCLNDREPRA